MPTRTDRPASYTSQSDHAPPEGPSVRSQVSTGVAVVLIGTFLIWLVTTGAGALVTTRRFERDSSSRTLNDTVNARDLRELRETVMHTDSGVRCLVAKPNPSPFCP